MAYTKTPDHPDFPHGTERGRCYGCPCTRCEKAHQRATKIRRTNRQRGVQLTATKADQIKVRRHVNKLLKAHPENSLMAIERAAKVGVNTLTGFMTRKTSRLYMTTVNKVLAVTPDMIEQRLMPSEKAITLVRRMQAAGFSFAWQYRQCGVKVDTIVAPSRKAQTVRLISYNKIKDLYDRVGHLVADPDRDGLTKAQITRARNEARSLGYYPPACYDEDGTLDWRAVPDHPWTVAEEASHERIARLERALRNPELAGRALATQQFGSVPKEGTDAHVDWHTLDQYYSRMLKRLAIRESDPGSPARRADLKEALWRFHRGEGDSISFCLEIGLLDLKAFELPADHPTVVQARADFKKAQLRKAARRQAAHRRRRAAARAAARAVESKQVAA